MEKFFFFTDIDKLKAQIAGQNFGIVLSTDPDNDSTKEKFRLTSSHSSTTDSNAYAICDGEVMVIEDQVNSNLLNLVLKPYKQPGQELPKIKYYIYKGILKSSLINGSDIAAASNNDLTARLWNSQSPPPASAILPPTTGFLVSNKISTSFYKNDPTNTESQMPKVYAGEKIGLFNASGFGLEIITDDVDVLHEETIGTDPPLYYSDPSYRYVKQAINYVEVNNSMSTDPQNNFFLKRNIKERILRYIDPCAFWGSFYDSTLYYNDSSNNEDDADGDDIYKEILLGTSSTTPFFINRNKVYIDIRNELNYSYDFFNNYQAYNFSTLAYTNKIKLAYDIPTVHTPFSSFSDDDYYRSNWPVLIIENDFIVNNTTDPNTLQISLPKGDNEHPLLFISHANLSLKKRFKSPMEKRIEEIEYTNSSGSYTEELKLKLNNFYDSSIPNTTTHAQNISNYYKLKVLKQISECPVPVSAGTVINREELLDNIILPLAMEIEWNIDTTASPRIKTRIFENETFIDAISQNGQSGIGNVGIAEYTTNTDTYVTLFAVIIHKTVSHNNSNNKKFNLESEVVTTDGDTSFIQYLSNRYSLKYKNDAITGVFNGINFATEINESLKNKGFPMNTQFTNPDADDIIFLTLTKAEFTTLTTTYAATFLPAFKKHLAVKFNSGQVPAPTTNHEPFVIFQLKLRSWLIDSTSNLISVAENNVAVGSEIHSLLPSKRIFLDQNPPVTAGKGFKISLVPGSHTYTEPNIFDRNPTTVTDYDNLAPNQITTGAQTPTITSTDAGGNPIKKYKITSTIYLIRGINLSAVQFCKLRNYIEKNVRNVWDSETNTGLAAHFIPNEEDNNGDRFVRHYLFDSSGVNVKVATSKQLNKLKDGEVLLYTDLSMGGRSFISGSTKYRTGEFYYDTQDDFHTEIDLYDSNGNGAPNTAGHEFGHVLGLADRYTYFAFVNLNHTAFPAVKRNASPITNTLTDDINGVRRDAGTTGLYVNIHENGTQDPDDEYCLRFNWLNNLMTTQSIVPEYDYPTYNNDTVADKIKNPVAPPVGRAAFSRIGLTRNYRRVNDTYYKYHAYFRPWIDPVASPKKYSKVCIFITKAQADIIIARDRESLENHVNFKRFEYTPDQSVNPSTNNPHPTYTGTFVGASRFNKSVSATNYEKILKSDDGIETYMHLSNLTGYSAAIHAMEGRLNITSTTTIHTLHKTFVAYFNPFLGNKALPEELIYPTDGPYSSDDYMHDVYYPNKPDPGNVVPDGGYSVYDIEIGGFAYNLKEGYDVVDIRSNGNYPRLQNTTVVIPQNMQDWISNPKALGVNAFRILILCAYHLSIVPTANLTPQEIQLLQDIQTFFNQYNHSIYSFFDGTQTEMRTNLVDKYKERGVENPERINNNVQGFAIWNAGLYGNGGRSQDNIKNYYCPPEPPDPITMNVGLYNPYGNDSKDFNGSNLSPSIANRHLMFPVYINRRAIMNLIKYARINQQTIYR